MVDKKIMKRRGKMVPLFFEAPFVCLFVFVITTFNTIPLSSRLRAERYPGPRELHRLAA
jgi:hypothetical protein